MQTNTLKADFSAGLASAMVSLPVAIGGGIIAVAPLGADYVSFGVKAGLVCAVVAAIVTAIFGSSKYSVGGPSASTSVVLAAALSQFAGTAPTAPQISLLMALVVALAGVFLVVAGVMRWGGLIKFIPRPVTAGFVNGVALLLFFSQLNSALGVGGSFSLPEYFRQIHIGAIVTALVTVLVCMYAPRYKLPIPAAFAGLSAGVAVHYLIHWLFPVSVGPVVGQLPALLGNPAWLASDLASAALADLPWSEIVAAAVLLSLMAAIQTLMTAVSVDALAHGRHDSNRELIGYGLGNVVAALSGGVASSANLGRAMANYRGGAATRGSGVVNGLFVLAVVLIVSPWISIIPMAVMAGILIHSSIVMVDQWSIDQLKRWLKGRERGEVVENVAVVVAMTLGMLWMSPVIAVGVGVILTMLLFLRRMSRTFVRQVYTCESRRSLKVRPEFMERELQSLGQGVHVIELEGAIFFGTADRLRTLVESHHGDARFVILDCRRVREWDATGVQILGQIHHALKQQGRRLLLAHVAGKARLEGLLAAYGLNEVVPAGDRFQDTDRALEAAEDALLADSKGDSDGTFDPLHDFVATSLFKGLAAAERTQLQGYFETHELVQGGTVFQIGDAGDRLFVLVAGEVTLGLRIDGQRELRRLSTITPGVVFGEMALLDALPRSAEAICVSQATLKSLSRDAFQRMRDEAPLLFATLLQNIAREMSLRLRMTNHQLGALES